MAYNHINSKGQSYYLNSMQVNLKGGRVQTIHFFSKDVRPTAIEAIPDGFMVVESERTGLPLLKRQ